MPRRGRGENLVQGPKAQRSRNQRPREARLGPGTQSFKEQEPGPGPRRAGKDKTVTGVQKPSPAGEKRQKPKRLMPQQGK